MKLNEIEEDYYYVELYTAYINLKKSKSDSDINLAILTLVNTYTDAVLSLGQSATQKLMRAIILYEDSILA